MPKLHIVLPLPPRELSPNARGGWQKTSKAKAEFRRLAHSASWRAMAYFGMEQPPRLREGELCVTFYHIVKRRRDPTNYDAMLKAAIDGIVDAGVYNDDDWLQPPRVRFEIDKANPRTELVHEW